MRTYVFRDDENYGFLSFVQTDAAICVSALSVARGQRMRGIGGQLLTRLCAHADAQRLPIQLSVTPLDYGPDCLPYGLLREWYMRRGFLDQHEYSEHLYRPARLD